MPLRITKGERKPQFAHLVGLEGVFAPPLEIPADDERTASFYILDPQTGRAIPQLRAADGPGIISRFREYLGITRPKARPIELEAAQRGLAGEAFVRPFDIRAEVVGPGAAIEEEARRVLMQGFEGFTGGIPALLRGYDESPETFPGAIAGGVLGVGGFLIGPFKGAKLITGTRLAPTARGMRGMAQILTEGAANLGLASSIAAIAPALLESDTLTELTFEISESAAMGGLIGLIYPAMGVIPNKVLRVAATVAVVDKVRAGPRQWFTLDDVIVGVKDGTISPRDLGRATFGVLMDTYFALKVPSMRKQLKALDNMYIEQIANLDVQEAENTILEVARRSDLQEPREGIYPEDINRAYGSPAEFSKVTELVGIAAIRPGEPLTDAQISVGRQTVAEQLAESAAATLEQARIPTGKLVPTESGFRRIKGFKEMALQMFPDLQGMKESPGKMIEAIRKDKENRLYLEILKRLKQGVTEADIRFLAEQAEQPGEEGFALFEKALEELAEVENIEPGVVRPAEPPAPPAPPVVPPKVPPPEAFQDAKAVEAMFNKADVELSWLRRKSLKQIRDALVRATVDVSGPAKRKLLEASGDLGREAIINKDLMAGMGAKADALTTEAQRIIEKDLTKVEDKLLERVIQARRTIAIDTHAERVLKFEKQRLLELPEEQKPEQLELIQDLEQGIKHPDRLGGKKMQNYLLIAENSEPEMFAKVTEKSDLYFSEFKKMLDLALKHDLITPKSHENLARVGDYSPRRFIQHIDPNTNFRGLGGKIISVPDSGIKRLDKGSTRVMEKNWRLLLRDANSRLHKRIGAQEANKALFAVATQIPENEVVKLHPEGPTPAGFQELSVMIKGQRNRMMMPDELARDWIQQDSAISSQMANFIGWISGAAILKPMATGINPEFALTNFPRDAMHVWMTTNEFSPHFPKFTKQFTEALAATRHGAFTRTGWYVDAINEGLGMNFLTHQGLTKGLTGPFADAQRFLSYAGETSELWVRGAVRHQALLNGKSPREATWIARNYMDFAQGGWLTKGADTAIPYLNARIVATRGIFRAAKQRPGQTMYKFAQVGSMAMGLYLANRYINEDAWNATKAREKVNNWILTMPSFFDFEDEFGATRHIAFQVAKDQSQRIVATVFEAMVAKALGDPVDVDQVVQAAQDFIPFIPTDTMPPAMTAFFGYMGNVDFWRNEPAWRGTKRSARLEYTKYTHPALIEVGRIGLSPDRTAFALKSLFTYGNIYTSMVGSGTRFIMEAAGKAEPRDSTTRDFLAAPGMRRLFLVTDPFEPFRKEIEDVRIKSQDEIVETHMELDKLSEKFYRAKKAGTEIATARRDVRQFIRAQEDFRQKPLLERFKFMGQVFELKERRFWLTLRAMQPEARATVFWTRWNQTAPKDRREFLEQASKLDGIGGDRFFAMLNKLRKRKIPE